MQGDNPGLKGFEYETQQQPDDQAADEPTALEQEKLRQAKATYEVELGGKKQNINARKEYATKIFGLIKVWLGSILALVFLSGIGKAKNLFTLSDSVLIALITTTTASVVGLFVIVVNYLFNNKK